MRFTAFAARNRKEMLRDPLTLIFTLGLPVVLLGLMQVLNNAIPGGNPAFEIHAFAPAMTVFSLSFLAMFLGLLIANDRASAFLSRLFTSPLKTIDYMLGYTLPMILVSIIQTVVCFAAAVAMGLSVTATLLPTLLVLIPIALMFVGLGILFGAWFTAGQVTGFGNLVIQVATLLGGAWFSLDMIGGAFRTIGYLLPFAHAIDAARAALSGSYGDILPHLLWVLAYTVLFYAVAVWGFSRRMRGYDKGR